MSGTWLHDRNERREQLNVLKRFRGFLDRSADSGGTGFLVQVLFFLLNMYRGLYVCVSKHMSKCCERSEEW